MKSTLKFLALGLLPILAACGTNEISSSYSFAAASSSAAPTYKWIKPEDVTLEFGDFHTAEQYAYLHSDYDSIYEFGVGTEELSRPRAITIETGDSTVLEYATNQDFTDSTVVSVSGSYDFINVYMATTYYYRSAASNEGLAEAEVKNFQTADYGPRNLYVDGVTNVRDCGGRLGSDGKRIAQGKLYRGARWNTSQTDEGVITEEITAEGKETVKNVMKIKTEIDLRTQKYNEVGSIIASVVEGVNYVNIPCQNTTGDYLTGNKEDFGQVYKLLADSSNYPIYFHCDIGTDRTGLVSYVIQNLFGVSDDEIYKDFLISNMAVIRGKRNFSTITNYEKDLEEYKKATRQEAIVEYLKDCGLTETDIANIKANLSE